MLDEFSPISSNATIAMKLRFSAIAATLGCVLLVACVPYDESKKKQQTTKPVEKKLTEAEQKAKNEKDKLDKLKKEEEAKKKADLPENTPAITEEQPTPNPEPPKPPTERKPSEYVFASKVPNKEGFVFSPYNNKIVDVRDIPSGTLVQDPTYTGAGKGYFRVP